MSTYEEELAAVPDGKGLSIERLGRPSGLEFPSRWLQLGLK